MEEILNIKEDISNDEAIQEYEYHEYESTGNNLNSPGEIRINIETQDIYLHPAESFIVVGQIQKADGTAYVDVDLVSLINNSIMYLFDCIRYQLSGQEIESIYHPGQATSILGLLKYSDDFSKSQGLNQCWFKDTSNEAANTNTGFAARHGYIIQTPRPRGTFSFAIPLKHIFGFCEDYNKVIYGFKHTLTMVRKSDNDAIFRAAAVDAGKVHLSKIGWYMPHVLPSDMQKLPLYKIIENKSKIEVGYRMCQCDTRTSDSWRLSVKSSPEKPRWVIMAFQTDKSGNQEKNPALFDHCNLINAHVMLNARAYPVVNYNADFDQHKFSRLYKNAADFRKDFFGMNVLISSPNITPVDYKSLFTIFVFDVSKQSERLKNSVTDINIKTKFSQNVPANTQAYVIVISARIL